MFIVREEFTAKPGQASKLAALFKDFLTVMPRQKARVLTDAVGRFNTVVIETEVADLSAHEKEMQEYMSRPDLRDKMKGYTDMYLTGRREIYRIV
jgi:hypothetical protein